MNWGLKITLLYCGFALLIAGLVTASVMQTDVHLVSPDYYKDEIAYQSRLDAINATPDSMVRIVNSGGKLALHFSGARSPCGDIWFFRPGDARLDLHIPINPDSKGLQEYATTAMLKGNWRVKIAWTENGKAYFKEQSLNI